MRDQYQKRYAINKKEGALPKRVRAKCPRCGAEYIAMYEYGWAGRTDIPAPKFCASCQRMVSGLIYYEVDKAWRQNPVAG